MKLNKRRCLKAYFVFMLGAFISTGSHQSALYAGVKPGVYEVSINDDPLENIQDTWIFSKDGSFKSERLGIKSEWEDTGTNTFIIKTDKKEILKAASKNLKLLGLHKSDFIIDIKKINISGTSQGKKIKGTMSTNFRITVKRPVKINFSTSGSVDFQGSSLE